MVIDVIGIIFIIILLLGLFLGFKRGLVASLLKAAKGLLALVGAFLLAKPVGKLLVASPVGDKIVSTANEFLVKQNSMFDIVVTAENRSEVIDSGLGSIKLPDAIKKIVETFIPETGGESIGMYLAQAIAYFACIIVAFIVLWIVIRIVVGILKKFLEGINRIPLVGLVNRIAGAAFGVAMSVLIVGMICWGISFIVVMPGNLGDYFKHTMQLESEQFTFSKWCYEKNIIQYLLNLMF